MRSLGARIVAGAGLFCVLFCPHLVLGELKTYVHNGTASYGGAISLDTARITAIVKAKQLALELAGTYIDSLAVLDKGAVDKHEIRAIAAGTAGAEIVDEHIDADSITVTARIDVDTGMLAKRVERMLEDRSVVKRLQLMRHKEDRYLERIQELEEQFEQHGRDGTSEDDDLSKEIEQSANHLRRLQQSESHLRSLLEKMDNPTLLVHIDEEYVGFDQPDLQTASSTINNALTAQGFDLVTAADDMNPRTQALAQGAEFMLAGRTVVSDAGEIVPGTGMHSYQAVIRIGMVHTQTNKVLGDTTAQAAAAHISPTTGASLAVSQATDQLIREYVVTTIEDAFRDFLLHGFPMEVVVDHVHAFQLYKQITAMIDQLPEILSAKKLAWSKDTSQLVLEVRSGLNVDETAELLDQAHIASGMLEVVDLGPGKLELVFTGTNE
jgi:hypothetical protein